MTEAMEQRSMISPPIRTAVVTGADRVLPATTKRKWRAVWQDFIKTKLLAWLQEPGQIADEGVDAPSPKILRLAIDYAEKLRDEGYPPPASIVPDANGGIVFERRQNGYSEVVHVWDDGIVELQLFHGTRLICRGDLA